MVDCAAPRTRCANSQLPHRSVRTLPPRPSVSKGAAAHTPLTRLTSAPRPGARVCLGPQQTILLDIVNYFTTIDDL